MIISHVAPNRKVVSVIPKSNQLILMMILGWRLLELLTPHSQQIHMPTNYSIKYL